MEGAEKVKKKNYIIGSDIGGTKIHTGIVDLNGKLIGKTVKVSTDAQDPAEKIVSRMMDTIKNVVRNSGIKFDSVKGIGLGLPGPLDMERGIILTPPNMKTMHGYKIKAKFEKEFKIPVFTNNDGNCFVLGETCFGAAKGENIVYGITLGTGFGNGIVIDKKIFNGSTGTAAENWISPYNGKNFEECLSNKGIVSMYYEKTGKKIESKEVYELAKKGDKVAIDTWKEYGYHLGIAMSYVVNLLDPSVIVVGGSLSNAFNFFIKDLMLSLKKNINPIPSQYIRVVKSKLGDNAGLIGAASQAL